MASSITGLCKKKNKRRLSDAEIEREAEEFAEPLSPSHRRLSGGRNTKHHILLIRTTVTLLLLSLLIYNIFNVHVYLEEIDLAKVKDTTTTTNNNDGRHCIVVISKLYGNHTLSRVHKSLSWYKSITLESIRLATQHISSGSNNNSDAFVAIMLSAEGAYATEATASLEGLKSINGMPDIHTNTTAMLNQHIIPHLLQEHLCDVVSMVRIDADDMLLQDTFEYIIEGWRDINWHDEMKKSSISVQTVSAAFPLPPPEARYKQFQKLDSTAQNIAIEKLGYTAETWNNHGLAPIEKKGWSSLTSNERTAAAELGFTQNSWDCFINHYGQDTWAELEARGVQEHYHQLGWTEAHWTHVADDVPYTESRWWDMLTSDEKDAANALCYFEANWDKVDMNPNDTGAMVIGGSLTTRITLVPLQSNGGEPRCLKSTQRNSYLSSAGISVTLPASVLLALKNKFICMSDHTKLPNEVRSDMKELGLHTLVEDKPLGVLTTTPLSGHFNQSYLGDNSTLPYCNETFLVSEFDDGDIGRLIWKARDAIPQWTNEEWRQNSFVEKGASWLGLA